MTALEGPEHATRQSALSAIQKAIERHPKSFGDNLLESINSWLDQQSSDERKIVDNEGHSSRSLQIRATTQMIGKLIKTRTESAVDEAAGRQAGDVLLLACLLLFHHPYFGAGATQIWLDNAVTAGCDPAILAQNEMDQIMSMITKTLNSKDVVSARLFRAAMALQANSSLIDQNRARKQAALQALTTVAFVAPHHYVPNVVRQVTTTMDPLKLAFIGEFEIGVWSTAEGELYEDGASSIYLSVGSLRLHNR